jgi:hypothetical protein
MRRGHRNEISEAMTLATATPRGVPSSRIVLFKGITENSGLSFYTNYKSRKGKEIDTNPKGALLFFMARTRQTAENRRKNPAPPTQGFRPLLENASTRKSAELGRIPTEQTHPESKNPFKNRSSIQPTVSRHCASPLPLGRILPSAQSIRILDRR